MRNGVVPGKGSERGIPHLLVRKKRHPPVDPPPSTQTSQNISSPHYIQHSFSLTCTRNQEMRTETQGFPLPEVLLAGDRTLPAGQDEEEKNVMNKEYKEIILIE